MISVYSGVAKTLARAPIGTPSIQERRNLARSLGQKRFDPATPCIHGHTAPRMVSSNVCIECGRIRAVAYNITHAEQHRANARRSAANRPEEVKAYRRAYYRANSAVAKGVAREWRMTNADRAKQNARAWAIAHPERVRERNLAWYKKHAPRLREKMRAAHAANPEPGRAAKRKWKRANKHKVLADDSARRAKEMGARIGPRKPYIAFVKWAREKASISCYWCKTKTTPDKRHLDHIIPIARGGADAVENLCVSCPPCNFRKNAKMPFEFAGQAELRFA